MLPVLSTSSILKIADNCRPCRLHILTILSMVFYDISSLSIVMYLLYNCVFLVFLSILY